MLNKPLFFHFLLILFFMALFSPLETFCAGEVPTKNFKDWSSKVLEAKNITFFRTTTSSQSGDKFSVLTVDVTSGDCSARSYQVIMPGEGRIKNDYSTRDLPCAIRADVSTIHNCKISFDFDAKKDLIFGNISDVESAELLHQEMGKGYTLRIKVADSKEEIYFRYGLLGFSEASIDQANLCAAKSTGANQGSSPESQTASSGTGFVINSDGYILTSNHVIEGANNIFCNHDEGSSEAKLIYKDKLNDLALIKIDKNFHTFFSFTENNIRLGESVVAMGYPLHGFLNTHPSVTSGIISSLAGPSDDTRIFQFTAPVQPGNSGGPVLNMSGNVVGVVMAKLDALKVALNTGDLPQNINFAINSSIIKNFLNSSGVKFNSVSDSQELKQADVASKSLKSLILVKTNVKK